MQRQRSGKGSLYTLTTTTFHLSPLGRSFWGLLPSFLGGFISDLVCGLGGSRQKSVTFAFAWKSWQNLQPVVERLIQPPPEANCQSICVGCWVDSPTSPVNIACPSSSSICAHLGSQKLFFGAQPPAQWFWWVAPSRAHSFASTLALGEDHLCSAIPYCSSPSPPPRIINFQKVHIFDTLPFPNLVVAAVIVHPPAVLLQFAIKWYKRMEGTVALFVNDWLRLWIAWKAARSNHQQQQHQENHNWLLSTNGGRNNKLWMSPRESMIFMWVFPAGLFWTVSNGWSWFNGLAITNQHIGIYHLVGKLWSSNLFDVDTKQPMKYSK